MFNPNVKIAQSKGWDIPVLKVYMAGRIAGECIDKCLEWRKELVDYYKNYKNRGVYPISFLDPLNSKEGDSIDKLGLKSAISSNLIYDKDLLSVKTADVVIANMDDFFEEGINDLYNKCNKCDCYGEIRIFNEDHDSKTICDHCFGYGYKLKKDPLKTVDDLFDRILNRRENIGTIMEVGWALLLQKPLILIVPERRKHIFENHPFTRRASVIVTSVKQLIKEKHLNILYKSISGATYD